jgi:prepilin-type N-terminal cleavage/methylation domain-containing protein
MAKNMIARPRAFCACDAMGSVRQKGFSMLELLLAAFILAVGILGLAMLQAMSLRASRGSSDFGTAVRIAERVMEQVELEGRLTWLNITDENTISPSTAKDLPTFNFKYISLNNGEKIMEEFNPKGDPVDPNNPDPVLAMSFFKVTTEKLVRDNDSIGRVGQMYDFNVHVEFVENLNNNKKPITRTLNITRRIIHG